MKERKKEKPGAMLYFDLIPVFDAMTDETAGLFIKGILHYARDDTEPDFSKDKTLLTVWPLVKSRLDHDSDRYKAVSLENSLKRRYGAYKAKRREKGQDALSFSEWKERELPEPEYDDSD